MNVRDMRKIITMTTTACERPTRSVLLSFKFVGTALAGSLTMGLVSTFAPLPAQIGVLGSCVSILAGLFVAYLEQEDLRERRRGALLERLRIPMALAPEHELFDQYCTFSEALGELARQDDPVLRRFALLKLTSLSAEVQALSRGAIVFSGTETWRTVYEQLLESPGIGLYQSVAWVKTRDYWQDPPGRQSMRLNYAMVRAGLRIERILILGDDLWPDRSRLPAPAIRPWVEEQHRGGITLSLVRQSEIAAEPDLLADFGIYGRRATGVQELDEQVRTVRFYLLFDPRSLQLARDRWERLGLYATPFADLLDGKAPRRRDESSEIDRIGAAPGPARERTRRAASFLMLGRGTRPNNPREDGPARPGPSGEGPITSRPPANPERGRRRDPGR
jgi:hypothetical protein